MFGIVLGQDAITVREYTVEIEPETTEIDIMNLLGSGEGDYSVKIFKYELFNNSDDECSMIFYTNNSNNLLGFNSRPMGFDIEEDGINFDNGNGNGILVVNNTNPNIFMSDSGSDMWSEPCINLPNGNPEGILTFTISGRFQNEDTSMGDMNNDGALNVYDVLIMVGIILDGDSGDIFDVMEIIKRV